MRKGKDRAELPRAFATACLLKSLPFSSDPKRGTKGSSVADDPEQTDERRTNRRVPVRFAIGFEGRHIEGAGYAKDISVSGALIEDAEPLLLAGASIRLRFSLLRNAIPIELDAQVVRETEKGFAVQFEEVDPRLRSILRMAIDRIRRSSADGRGPDSDEEQTLLTVTKPPTTY